MSSFYDLASLVMIPSGKKAGKVYSQKPLTTDGQLDFTRASTATRIGSDGKIEKTRTNLLLQSNSFVTSWGGNQSSMTSGQAGYDGTNNANLHNASGGYSYRSQTGTFSGVNTFSIYAKAGTAPCIRLYTTGSISLYANFDLSAGSIIDNQGIDAKITSVGNGWYRCSFTFTASNNTIYYYCADSGGNVATVTSGDNILVQNAQVEPGLVATDYIATTSAAVSVGSVDNMPRLNYTPGSATSCPALLLEPQRTNLIPQSEYLGDWSLTNGTLTTNATVSPDGTQNAGRVVFNNNALDFKRSIAVSASTTYTYSFYIKLEAGASLQGRFYDNSNGANIEYYDYTSQITSSDWSKITRTFTTPSGCTSIQVWLLAHSGSIVTASFWGAQLEVGSYATSYIPTFGATVTRVADACSKASISGLIGQTEGTLYVEIDWNVKPESGSPVIGIVTLNNGANNLQNTIVLGIERQTGGTNRVYCFVIDSNVTQAAIFGSSITDGVYKIAFAYKANDFALYVNGSQIGTDTSGSVPALSEVLLGKRFGTDAVIQSEGTKQALLFKTRLSNSQLAELTSTDS